MTNDPLNFFEPFEHAPANHENQLTRAFLVLLRLSPMVHEYWLSRLGDVPRLAQLPPADFDTQKRAIPLEADENEAVPLVSVFLAPNEMLSDGAVLTASERTQVLDAIVSYPGALVVVVENKVAEASAWQAANLNISGVAVKIAKGQKPVLVRWPDLLADLNGILERGLVSGAEHAVLADFLTYIEDNLPDLGPYRTLALCAGEPNRVARRLRSILSEASGSEARIDKWGARCDLKASAGIGSRAYLNANSDTTEIRLGAYPADTLTQAWAFYTSSAAVESVRALIDEPGWRVHHNFHFGHFQAGYAWTNGDISAGDYIDVWVGRIDEEGAVKRDDWDDYFQWLEKVGVAKDWDRDEFDRQFTDTKRSTATPRPGLAVERIWSYSEAEALDSAGKLVNEVATAFKRLQQLGA